MIVAANQATKKTVSPTRRNIGTATKQKDVRIQTIETPLTMTLNISAAGGEAFCSAIPLKLVILCSKADTMAKLTATMASNRMRTDIPQNAAQKRGMQPKADLLS